MNSDEEYKCVNCGDKLDFNIPVIMRINKVYCSKCISIIEKKAETEEQERIKNEIISKKEIRLNNYMSTVPKRYSVEELNEPINKSLIDSTCSILYGGFGTGKTWEAYSLIKNLYCNLVIKNYKIITEAGLINHLKAGFSSNSFEERMKTFKETDLLIVDEMGKSNDSDFNKAQLFEILNYRYDWMKKTVLICNCIDKSELVEILNPAITDRYRELIIKMDGNSKRYIKNGR